MVDFLSPQKRYSAAKFQEHANSLIKTSLQEDKLPIIVGGSGFYFRALQHGVFPVEVENSLAQNFMQRMTAKEKLAELQKRDPDALNPRLSPCIHPNDQYRIERALYIHMASNGKQKWSTLWKNIVTTPKHDSEKKQIQSEFLFDCYTLPLPEDFRLRLEGRINQMLDNGLVEEAQSSLEIYGESHGFKTAGYSLVHEYSRNMFNREMLVERLTNLHYQIARKQQKWFSKMSGLQKLTKSQLIKVLRQHNQSCLPR